MIYLTTGGNGAGKTLLTLRDVREKSLKENRPVYWNGRFRLKSDFGWVQIEAKDWQDAPDGAIFLFDECHNDFPNRQSKDAVPDYVKMLAEHRVRGFDFYLLTQHPLNVDIFIRRLISSPGWHRHLKRASGAALVSVLEWSAVNGTCEKPGSGATGSTTLVPYPKEVYDWYESTTLDTAKLKIPFQVKLLVFSLLAVPVLGYFVYQNLSARTKPKVSAAPVGAVAVGASAAGAEKHVLTPAEYLATYTPRVVGLAYTAPRYDALTMATSAPFPAGCVASATRCDCYTDQGTKLPTDKALCLQFSKDGYFKDWGQQAAGALPIRSIGKQGV